MEENVLKHSICLICANQFDLLFDSEGNRVTVKEEHNEELSDDRIRTCYMVGGTNFKWEIDIYEFFKNYMKILLPPLEQRSLKKREWNLKTEPVPLCDLCKEQLFPLKKKYEELKRLEELVKEGMCLMREKMEACEKKFMNDNVYNLDRRYYAVRSSIIRDKVDDDCLKGGAGSKRKSVSSTKEKIMKTLKEKAVPSPKRKINKASKEPIISGGDHFEDAHSFEDDNANLSCPASPAVEDEKKNSTSISPLTSTKIELEEVGNINAASLTNFKNEETNSLRRTRRSVTKRTSYKDDLELDLDDLNESPSSKRNKLKHNDKDDLEDFETPDEDEEVKKPKKRRNKMKYEALQSKTKRFEPRLEENGQYTYLHHFFDVLGEKRFQCTKCKDVMETINAMKVHVFRAHLTHSCPWPYCNFVATTKPSTELHFMKTHDKIESKRFCCDICGMPLTRPTNIAGHRRTHYGEEERREALIKDEQHLCTFCGKSFGKKQGLNNHLKVCPETKKDKNYETDKVIKTKNEKHLCPQCGKALPSASGLSCHLKRYHPDPKDWRELPFACIYCDKRFVRQRDLKTHKVTQHTKEFPYPCGQCEQKFMSKKNYDNHMMLHTGKRPFQCEFCPIGFVTKGNLDRHLKIYHSEGSKPRRTAFSKNPKKGFYRGRKLRESEEWGKVDFTCRDVSSPK